MYVSQTYCCNTFVDCLISNHMDAISNASSERRIAWQSQHYYMFTVYIVCLHWFVCWFCFVVPLFQFSVSLNRSGFLFDAAAYHCLYFRSIEIILRFNWAEHMKFLKIWAFGKNWIEFQQMEIGNFLSFRMWAHLHNVNWESSCAICIFIIKYPHPREFQQTIHLKSECKFIGWQHSAH